jgi:hypothetical protein
MQACARDYIESSYEEVQRFRGTLSENVSEYRVVIEELYFYSDVTVEIRNFVTNGTPLTLVLETEDFSYTYHNFYNRTIASLNHSTFFDYVGQIVELVFRYAGSQPPFQDGCLYVVALNSLHEVPYGPAIAVINFFIGIQVMWAFTFGWFGSTTPW